MSFWYLGKLVSAWILPPGLLILTGLTGLACARRWPVIGRLLIGGSLLAFWALSTPWLSNNLLKRLEPPALDVKTMPAAQAIVVLGGGRYRNAPEYAGDTVSSATLERVRYAARLHGETEVPLLVSGGAPDGPGLTEAEAMKRVLESEFKVPVRWLEQVSSNTFHQARATLDVLKPQGIRRIYLVTHAWHMPRSVQVYTHAGFDVVAAPTAFKMRRDATLRDFMPSGDGMLDSHYFFHEVVGMVWHRLRFQFGF